MEASRDYEAFARFAAAKAEVDQMPIHLCDRAGITVPEITGMVDQITVQQGPLDLVVVDYLQLLTSPESSRAARQSEAVRVGEISRGFKLLAKDRHVPVVLLSQLNREIEHRQGNRPQLSDLRDSGAIEQDADIVMFIHRKMEDSSSSLVIAKHRNGPVLDMGIQYHPELTRYVEMERETSSPAPSQRTPEQEAILRADLE
jgi:replicative DNA helicase